MKLMLIMLAGMAMQDAGDADPTQTPLAERTAVIETCLAGPGLQEPDTCIGAISTPCMELPGGGGALGMNLCMMAEIEVWDSLMDRWLAEALVAEDMTAEHRQALQAGQTAWVTAREESIKVYSGRQGSIWSNVTNNEWQDWTARRALWLRDIAQDQGG